MHSRNKIIFNQVIGYIFLLILKFSSIITFSFTNHIFKPHNIVTVEKHLAAYVKCYQRRKLAILYTEHLAYVTQLC